MTVLFARHALLPGGTARDVVIEMADGRFTAVTPDSDLPAGAEILPGVVLPGFANAHSHAFHRALRGRTHAGGGTFWTWRRAMYALASRLDPDTYLALARAVYAEMALAGITTVGEFHYLHHAAGGRRYADPNAMGRALQRAAADTGIRLTLLDTCYLAGGLHGRGHQPLDGVQRRFADSSVDAWAARVEDMANSPGFIVGAAVHSVRAVPRDDLPLVVAAAGERPLHVHLSEQPAENEAALSYYGRTPTALLDGAGALTPRTTVVHATHLDPADVATLGAARVTACLCPTTEQDLADGIGPARALADAGAVLSLGSDQNVVVDLIAEARALESGERLASRRRGRFHPRELLAAATAHASLGWPDAGAIAPGLRADLVCVRSDTVRTAGAAPDEILLVATAADIDTVYADGSPLVTGGRHRLGDVGASLTTAIGSLWEDL
ncbi:Formiminoglutamate deiminase [Frankia canadensis]|uniref:Formiminoglutamate deiminase n=1 Tax=Frankia canadensis TaxID=1836972 RepID=A0A2I2KJH7_9ACTN|nr:formimidoylglutamate deiminase [Frankia canadensis]SNQ45807.1 Formiminoglutamate deiminase [Frankia canadensis]SOU53097.1 Formiminoglutamate deiminase [Frankia canadensis]